MYLIALFTFIMVGVWDFLKDAFLRAVAREPLGTFLDMLQSTVETRFSATYIVALIIRVVVAIVILMLAQYIGVPVEDVIAWLARILQLLSTGTAT